MALRAVLVSPEFLFRVEQDPAGRCAAYRLSHQRPGTGVAPVVLPVEQHSGRRTARCGRSRESFRTPAVLEQQVRRMLADARSRALVNNFAEQWLYLRNLASTTPDMRLFPDFDDNLRQAFRQETELFFESIMREDRSVLDLLSANYTFVNERLAKHYGIPNVYGSRFRRVTFGEDSVRGGLLRQGSILTVTSYATRTSPVIRGKWILDNILGVPPPPPPPVVPALKENTAIRQGSFDARAHGRASRQSRLLGLPSADGSGRLLARELRCGGPLANRRRRQAHRRFGRSSGWQQVRGCRRTPAGPAAAVRSCLSPPSPKSFSPMRWAAESSTTTPRRSARSCGRPRPTISGSRRYSGNRQAAHRFK